MGIFDFLLGKPEQTGQLDPQTKAARDFLLNQMLQQYSAGPVNVPQYQAVAPAAMYSGTNDLLSSLGLGTVAPPSLPTTEVGGMQVYTSQPFQENIETSYAEQYPGQYEFLKSFYMDPVTGDPGTRSYGYVDPNAPVVMSGGNGGNNNDADPFNIAPSYTSGVPSSGLTPAVPYNPASIGTPGQMSNTSYTAPMFSGGGADGVGNFGKIGDYFGGIGNAIGLTNY